MTASRTFGLSFVTAIAFTPLALSACGSSATGGSGGSSSASSGSSASSSAGGGGGSGFTFPAPQVGGTPEGDALAAAPARCGQPAYTWTKSANLGHVTAHTDEGAYTKGLLQTLLTAAMIDVPITLKYDVETHLLTYITQDRGKELEATTLIAWPSNVPAETPPLPALLVLHGTSGFKDGCGATADSSLGQIAAAIASSGYIVVVPDYIGLKSTPPPTGFPHPYLVGQATAIASLDAVRTLGNLPAEIRTGGARPSPRFVTLGGSQGGHAALWVDRLAPYYARELDLAGVAATVPPADLLGEGTLALTMLRDSSSNIAAFYGASSSWYGADKNLAQVFVPPLDANIPKALAASCDPGDVLSGAQMLDQVFQPPLLMAATSAKLGSVDPWGCMVAENGLTTTSIKRIQKAPASYGILFITGEKDTLVDTPTERVAYKTLCDAGMPLQYLECAGASHTKTTTWSLPEILTFLNARIAGEAFTPSCTVSPATTCKGTPMP